MFYLMGRQSGSLALINTLMELSFVALMELWIDDDDKAYKPLHFNKLDILKILPFRLIRAVLW
jgi:hypothetical protein